MAAALAINDLCLKPRPTTSSVLNWKTTTMPCPEPWGRQRDDPSGRLAACDFFIDTGQLLALSVRHIVREPILVWHRNRTRSARVHVARTNMT